MSNVDIAKLKRLKSAVESALEHVPEQSAHGVTPTYNSLRKQILDTVPVGLKEELEGLAPEIRSGGTTIDRVQVGADAYARLASLRGWLDAIIKAE